MKKIFISIFVCGLILQCGGMLYASDDDSVDMMVSRAEAAAEKAERLAQSMSNEELDSDAYNSYKGALDETRQMFNDLADKAKKKNEIGYNELTSMKRRFLGISMSSTRPQHVEFEISRDGAVITCAVESKPYIWDGRKGEVYKVALPQNKRTIEMVDLLSKIEVTQSAVNKLYTERLMILSQLLNAKKRIPSFIFQSRYLEVKSKA